MTQYLQDGDESNSKELEGVTGKARRPDPHAHQKPKIDNGNDGRSPDGEQG